MSDLDRQVAEALGWHEDCTGKLLDSDQQFKGYAVDFSPSTNWEQCGKLIEGYGVNITYLLHSRDYVEAWPSGKYTCKSKGATPQEAVCRAVIAMKEGET